MTFQLDTSGAVCAPIIDGWAKWPSPVLNVGEPMRWSSLSPFVQGYIEALFAECTDDFSHDTHVGFRHLAPETLARIIADCEEMAKIAGTPGKLEDGRTFWRLRQQDWQGFSPLTVHLGNGGKVRFA